MRHELLVPVQDGDVEVGVSVTDEAPERNDHKFRRTVVTNHASGNCLRQMQTSNGHCVNETLYSETNMHPYIVKQSFFFQTFSTT